jgi:predicted RNA-binding Zn-ribbon protein involved in translation (DUF1610 family)
MRQYKPRVCELCGKEFIPTTSNQKFCSECKTTARKLYNYNYQRTVVRPDRIKTCARCGKEFYAKHLNEKYCPECKEIYRKEQHINWNKKHPEIHRESQRKWRKTHLKKHKELQKKYRQRHRKEIRAKQDKWWKEHHEKLREKRKRHSYRRERNLDFIPLNKWRPGYEAHHLDRKYIIYIPKDIHQSIRHSVLRNQNMDEINAIAWNYL